ncbi:MAG: hypothetical protein ACJ72N_07410 [Labedaea sp.]|jgi:hypothetical protein
MRLATIKPKVGDVIDLVRVLRRIMDPIAGEAAAVVAHLIHEADISHPEQLGNAYFRCHRECGGVRDCTDLDDIDIAFILSGGVQCPECNWSFTVEDLRISEGWVDEL